jgi:hypothetical protein
MTTHEARTAKIAETLRTSVIGDWTAIKIARVGTVYVHRIPQTSANLMGLNEMWVRLGSEKLADSTAEFRGTAEEIAKHLCLTLKAPSKAVDAAALKLLEAGSTRINPCCERGIASLKAPEAAAWLGLDELTTGLAYDLLAERGYGIETETGWRYAE